LKVGGSKRPDGVESFAFARSSSRRRCSWLWLYHDSLDDKAHSFAAAFKLAGVLLAKYSFISFCALKKKKKISKKN
jgi:hypothetical protein